MDYTSTIFYGGKVALCSFLSLTIDGANVTFPPRGWRPSCLWNSGAFAVAIQLQRRGHVRLCGKVSLFGFTHKLNEIRMKRSERMLKMIPPEPNISNTNKIKQTTLSTKLNRGNTGELPEVHKNSVLKPTSGVGDNTASHKKTNQQDEDLKQTNKLPKYELSKVHEDLELESTSTVRVDAALHNINTNQQGEESKQTNDKNTDDFSEVHKDLVLEPISPIKNNQQCEELDLPDLGYMDDLEPNPIVNTSLPTISKNCDKSGERNDLQEHYNFSHALRLPLLSLDNSQNFPNPTNNVAPKQPEVTFQTSGTENVQYLQIDPSGSNVSKPVNVLSKDSDSDSEIISSPRAIPTGSCRIPESATESTDEIDSLPDSQKDFSSDDADNDPDFTLLEQDLAISSSDEDINTRTNTSDQILLTEENETEKKGRKRKAEPEKWKKNKAKILRNSGKAYTSTSKSGKQIGERKMKPPCQDKCKLQCSSKINNETRQVIFNSYWGMGNLEKQRQFLHKCLTTITPKYRYIRVGSTRKDYNRAFRFEINNEQIRVCKTFFKNTLGISDRPIRTVIKKQNSMIGGLIESDRRGKHNKHKKLDNTLVSGVHEHIQSIPRIESHYCRSRTTREFIEGGLTVAELHRLYVAKCKTENKPHVDYQTYYTIFTKEYNISFWTPKKDQCEDCTAYENAEDKEPLKAKYDTHLLEKDLSRQEKEKDKKNASENSIVSVYDLQAVMPCPKGDVSNFFYVSKLNVLNFTLYELGTKDVDCYVWHEGEGARGVNEIGSCIFKYLQSLQEKAKDDFDVIFYSDNCCGQQKNKFMIAMYIYAVNNLPKLKSITHKFLIKGHSQNEGDSVHATIERNISRSLKSSPIYVPDQYITLIRTARKTGKPYNVHELDHESFVNIKKLADSIGSNYNVNEDKVKVKMTDFKVVKVEKTFNDRFFYKCSYTEEEFQTIIVKTARSKTGNLPISLKKLYTSKLTVSDSKKKGILTLIEKNIVPRFYRSFYENL